MGRLRPGAMSHSSALLIGLVVIIRLTITTKPLFAATRAALDIAALPIGAANGRERTSASQEGSVSLNDFPSESL